MPTFTKDWFSTNIPRWEKHLARFKGQPTTALELGSFEGRSAIWLLDNILTHPDSFLFCADLTCSQTLLGNLAPYAGRHSLWKCDATGYLIYNRNVSYDIAYIDAEHIARDVVMQAGLVWRQINPGGMLIFDDYDNTKFTVKPAVDFFLQHWTGHETIYLKHQAMILKK